MMLNSRWKVGFQDAFQKFVSSSPQNNAFFNQKEFELIDSPPLQKGKSDSAPIKEKACFIPPTSSSNVTPKKRGRKQKSDTPASSHPSNMNQEGTPRTNKLSKSYVVQKSPNANTIKKNSQKICKQSENLPQKRSPSFKERQNNQVELKALKDKKNNRDPHISESNQYATRCPYCMFWKLKSGFQEHVESCQKSSTTAPFESLLSAINDLKNLNDVEFPSIQNATKQAEESTIKEYEDDALINYSSKSVAKRLKQSNTKPKPSSTKDTGWDEFYLERPKRKAGNMALKSFRDMLKEEENAKKEDLKYYQNFSTNTNNNARKRKLKTMQEATKVMPAKKDPCTPQGEDDVAQLANELIKNWDTTDLVKKVFDIEPVADEFKIAKKQAGKSQIQISGNEQESPCIYCQQISCNNDVRIQNCLSCNYITYRKCDLERHIKEKHDDIANSSNDAIGACIKNMKAMSDDINFQSIDLDKGFSGFNMERLFDEGLKYATAEQQDGNNQIMTKDETKSNNVSLNAPVFVCKECLFTSTSEVMLNTHVIINH